MCNGCGEGDVWGNQSCVDVAIDWQRAIWQCSFVWGRAPMFLPHVGGPASCVEVHIFITCHIFKLWSRVAN